MIPQWPPRYNLTVAQALVGLGIARCENDVRVAVNMGAVLVGRDVIRDWQTPIDPTSLAGCEITYLGRRHQVGVEAGIL